MASVTSLRHQLDRVKQRVAIKQEQERDLRVLLQRLQAPASRDELYQVELRLDGIVPFDAEVQTLYDEAKTTLDQRLEVGA